MTDNDTVKDLLAKAFTQEPPLRIDRDEVLQQGRKRLRRRRVFEASSVVAAVLVAAVGAATLTNLADEPDPNRMPPAASTTAPPEPSSQPMPPQSITTTSPGPEPPSEGTSLPADPDQALELTVSLHKSGLLAPFSPQSVEGPVGEPRFTAKDDGSYEYEADLYDQQAGPAGYLTITVDYAPGERVDCSAIPDPFYGCELRGPVATARSKSSYGEFQNYAVTVLDDGTRVVAVSSSMTMAQRLAGHQPTAKEPPFDEGALRALVIIPGFSVH